MNPRANPYPPVCVCVCMFRKKTCFKGNNRRSTKHVQRQMLQRQKQTDAAQKTWFKRKNRCSTREKTVDVDAHPPCTSTVFSLVLMHIHRLFPCASLRCYYARAGKDENKEINMRCRPPRCPLVYAHASSLSSAVERVIMIMSPRSPGGRGNAHFQTLGRLAVKEIMQDLFSTTR